MVYSLHFSYFFLANQIFGGAKPVNSHGDVGHSSYNHGAVVLRHYHSIRHVTFITYSSGSDTPTM